MKKLFSLLIVLALLAAPVTFADESHEHNEVNMEELNDVVQQSTLLLQLKQKLAQIQYRYTLLTSNVDHAKESLVEIDEAITNLEMVLANLDDQIDDTDHQITSVKTQKERKKMEIADLEEEIQILELQFEDQKDLVGDLMTLIYVKRDIYYDKNEVNPVKVLASPDSVSKTLQDITYLDMVEDESRRQMEVMDAMSTELSDKWTEHRQRKAELDELDEELAEEAGRLDGEYAAQFQLLEEMKSEKSILEAMLQSSDEREEDLLAEIKIYQNNVWTMEDKLSGMVGGMTDEQRALIAQIEGELSQDFDLSESSEFLQLDWPVPPKGLTAFFHDGGYKEAFGVDHYALDIRANQGSSIFAPADGVVSAVVYDETSTKYAYIQIAHRMGVMTVYGHVSAVAVSAGDYVSRGQLIGYTGAAPGSVGAGVRTTGPHLHFEVWQDGVRVDPLNYLPLEEVALEELPEEFQVKVQDALENQIKDLQEAIGL